MLGAYINNIFVRMMDVVDELMGEITTYQADFDEWVQNGCKKAAERINQAEERQTEDNKR